MSNKLVNMERNFQEFFRKENFKKCTNFEEQKGTRYNRGNIYICIIIFSCLSSTKPCLRFLLNWVVRKIKVFYQSSFWNEVDFRDIMDVSLNISAKKQFCKTRFCKRKSNDQDNINVFLSLENPCTFLLTKEKTWKHNFNINSELSQNRAKKQITSYKTTVNWLFNDMRCYLVMAFFDWKTGIFQQTVVRVYCILKQKDH